MCHLSAHQSDTHSPYSSVCRYFPAQSECSPAPGRELPECSPPPAASLRSPPANWRHREWMICIASLESGECTYDWVMTTWQCRSSICSLLQLGRFCPWLSTVERSSWASASRAWVLFRSLLSFFSTSKSLWPTWKDETLHVNRHLNEILSGEQNHSLYSKLLNLSCLPAHQESNYNPTVTETEC